MTSLYPQKLALTSPTGGSRSVGIVRVRTKAMEFSFSNAFLHVNKIQTTDHNYSYLTKFIAKLHGTNFGS